MREITARIDSNRELLEYDLDSPTKNNNNQECQVRDMEVEEYASYPKNYIKLLQGSFPQIESKGG